MTVIDVMAQESVIDVVALITYAIATGISASQILASSLLIGMFLLIIGATGAITAIGRYIPKPAVRGVQLSTGGDAFLPWRRGVGLAAHYRFGARTAGSNIIIEAIFLVLAVILGVHALYIIYLIPIPILGVLLIFAGSQLALTVIDMKKRKDLFVALIILGITLVTNLAFGFLIGICVAYSLKSDKLTV